MRYIPITSKVAITVILKDTSEYQYIIRKNNDLLTLGTTNKAPYQLTNKSAIGKDIWNYLELKSYQGKNAADIKTLRREDFSKIMSSLQNTIKEQQENFIERDDNSEHYIKLYNNFEAKCKENDYTPLQFIAQVSHGLGIGLTIEILQAFFAFYSTYVGEKGTNVITIGTQSSGKSHILEQGLRFIPEESIYKGVRTVANFFRDFNKKDVTGHIFYLGDLGGDYDDQETLRLRDILKVLTTDGYVERGIVDQDMNAEKQFVTGFPCLCYSTAKEEMINSQEKSRSILITPPDTDPYRLEAFNMVNKTPGINQELIDTINYDVELVKGLTYASNNQLENVECFNPYMFNIVEYLKGMQDYNRKINEFKAILKLCCWLNSPQIFKHNLYDDKITKLVIATKQDNLNALALFGNTVEDLLPTELALANGLFENFELYPFLDYTEFETYTDFQKAVQNTVSRDEDGNILWQDVFSGDQLVNCFFTISYIRSNFGNKNWYRKNKAKLSNKLRKLKNNNILIEVGKDGFENIYGLSFDIEQKIRNMTPVFGGKNLKKARRLFRQNYPQLFDEVDELIARDSKINLKKIDFEIDDSTLYNILW